MLNPSATPSPPSYEIVRAFNGTYFEQLDFQNDKHSTITIDEDVSLLPDGTYSYKIKAHSSSECGVESAWSNVVNLRVQSGIWVCFPTTPVTNLRLELIKDGKFEIKWSHIDSSIVISDPDYFNIYVDEDPSAETWTLLDTVTYISPGLLNYPYTTGSYEHGQEVTFRVFPVCLDGSLEVENPNDLTVTGIADAEGPVVETDMIDTIVIIN